jgi:F0F1-type ATP synthase delta subunit
MISSDVINLAQALYLATKDKPVNAIELSVKRAVDYMKQRKISAKAMSLFEELEKIHQQDQNVAIATVASKRALTSNEIISIRRILTKILKKNVQIKQHVDKNIWFGFKVRCEDILVDATGNFQLARLLNHLNQAN